MRNCEQPLTLVDIGGRIDDYNREICKPATQAHHLCALAKLPVADTPSESTYTITRDADGILCIAFGVPGSNDQLV